ncbi:pyridoxamine 5'-phosphate oxidase family protein [Streptomyces sp. NPDC004749]|nr:pyridoxamine 5'-phosphate oxidase family protein [Streptomyces sp. NRRL F-5135]
MQRDARERFLADVHVGVLGVTDTRGESAPLLVPVWYRYEPGGDVVVQTARSAVKTRLVEETGRFSLCVQDETAPYRYVSVEGPVVSVTDPADAAEREATAHRYLESDDARDYLTATAHQLTEDITLRMRPERWRTADFAAFAAEFAGSDGNR